MLVQREPNANNSVSSYTEQEVVIQGITYHHSIIVTNDVIVSPWPIRHLKELDETHLGLLVSLKPDVILIGHNASNTTVPSAMMAYLSQKRIGIESLSLGAACRTFNVLLSEKRNVALGVIL